MAPERGLSPFVWVAGLLVVTAFILWWFAT
jgi:hypothetical protein